MEIKELRFHYDPAKGGIDIRVYGISLVVLNGFKMLPEGIKVQKASEIDDGQDSGYYFTVEKKMAPHVTLDSWACNESQYPVRVLDSKDNPHYFDVKINFTPQKSPITNNQGPTVLKEKFQYTSGVLSYDASAFEDPQGVWGSACRIESEIGNNYTVTRSNHTMEKCKSYYYKDFLTYAELSYLWAFKNEIYKIVTTKKFDVSVTLLNEQLQKKSKIDLNPLFNHKDYGKHYQENGVRLVVKSWDRYSEMTKKEIIAFPDKLVWQ